MAAEDGAAAMHDSFLQEDVMAVEDKFEQLRQPMYKGKKLDDPINTAVVRSTTPPLYLMLKELSAKFCNRTNGNFFLHFLKSRVL